MTRVRHVWFTDRYGAAIEDNITLEQLSRLLDTIAAYDGDDEHRSISLSDEGSWNLEFYPGRVLFENVEAEDGEVGTITVTTRAEELAVADEFLRGDFDALNDRNWE